MTGLRSIFISGAGRGIGRATADLFLSRGWRAGLFDVDADAVAEAAAGRPAAVHGSLDVRDADQWARALRDFCGDGGLDVLVNNAGVLSSGAFTELPADVQQRMVDVNVTGVVNGSLAGHPYLRRSHGLLLNLCSASALYGQPTLATYGATKAAVKSLTEALDIEWRGTGVRVRSLLPLFVDTEMVTRDGRRATSVAHLGVRLTADDVAAAAWKVAHERRRRVFAGPHRPVGRQTRLMAAASAVTPDWANRLVVSRLAR